ncbi:MAG: peptidase [Bacteroidota bacterium]|nr:peptidase [Bacteroidota bacterium]
MRRIKKILKYALGAFLLIIFALVIYVSTLHISPPTPENTTCLNLQPKQIDTNCYTIGNNWIRKSNSGLWEMYVEGKPFERGVINGKLAQQLVQKQEEAFTDQISKMIPSSFYRKFLKYSIAVFNRNLAHSLTEEEKLEIYGVSKAASSEFNYIGSPYERILNYHAAHDIGHALQNLALVGCSSFATWNSKSKDSTLLSGRNFDFYVGDKFAEDKLILFCNPEKGYKFMYITWGGFTGVVSGMNMQGLSITLNASKSSIPTGAATPVSLIGREILQYAKNIDEAIKIAKTRKSFVAETFMISSAADNKTVIIEKTPETTGVAYPSSDYMICTNHNQSKELVNTAINKEQMATSASVYRYKRIEELLSKVDKNTPQITADILRDQAGLHGAFIGMGNEKAVNQLICHHSVIFDPKHRIVWISTSPWQLGKYVAYDLNKIFAMHGLTNNHEINDSSLTIAPDKFLLTPDYLRFLQFLQQKQNALDGKEVDIQKLITSDPEFYDAYVIAGNYLMKKKRYSDAKIYFEKALTKVIATKNEEESIRKHIAKCDEEIKSAG